MYLNSCNLSGQVQCLAARKGSGKLPAILVVYCSGMVICIFSSVSVSLKLLYCPLPLILLQVPTLLSCASFASIVLGIIGVVCTLSFLLIVLFLVQLSKVVI